MFPRFSTACQKFTSHSSSLFRIHLLFLPPTSTHTLHHHHPSRSFSTFTRILWKERQEPLVLPHSNENNKVYTSRPVSFWMDQIAEKEKQREKKNADKIQTTTERVLIEKTMRDSYTDIYLPFKSSPELLEQYIFVDGGIRTGKLLEDLDNLAYIIASKHAENFDPNASPITMVTASMDRLDLFLPKVVENYKLSGNVTYVGSSSMEILIKAEIVPEGADVDALIADKENIDVTNNSKLDANTILITRFTMVAIDAKTHKPIKINPLRATSPEEERLIEVAKKNKMRKKLEAEKSLDQQPPTAQESLEMHRMYLEASQYMHPQHDNGDDFIVPANGEKQRLPSNCVWMADTRMDNLIFCHAQFRNSHGNIFGGFIMRMAVELSYCTASTFLHSSSAVVLSMDRVTFRKPVFVGSLLSMKAGIVYSLGSPHSSFQVRVVASVIDIEKNTKEITNEFYFTMAPLDHQVTVPRVLPHTYAETIHWLDGKRRRTFGKRARSRLLEDLALPDLP
ncbi:acyl-CoA thioester hydrolase [Halteromyces radiatus]|uniref:acyl-CoA thioester hydrolase n=1 Tax=Halteromyces radiatus TaxID=101107 RepID=UPI00221F0A86|nr:acyl-CoA thioester hydrolase [Halteromyces radiatus]KAI8093361.1 acyl-CoA thioester hydrolase [Halteromyces radiatus]